MLNRTNRTLSANLNRLNLGTRSLASLAQVSFNSGTQTLHTRHAYAVVMRAGMVGDLVDPIVISIGRYEISPIPGSPSVSSWLTESYAIQPRVSYTTSAAAFPAGPGHVNTFDHACLPAGEPGPRPTRLSKGRGRAERKTLAGKRRPLQQGTGLVQAVAGQWKPEILGPAAARVAAAGG